MNKLTLGQLIDTMKVGDIARSNRKVTEGIGYYFIKREANGFVVWNGQSKEDINNLHYMKLEICFTKFEWEILPRFVSFIDAIKAFKGQGKMITNYRNGNEYHFYWEEGEPMCTDSFGNHYIEDFCLPFTETFEGKWTIEE